jgi:hypothetical protein
MNDETSLDRVVREYQRPDLFVAGTEEASPWVPFGDQAYIRHLSFDVRTNSMSNVLWVEGGGMLGRHKHRGPVSGFVLEGSWRYLEYDWVATPGGWVHESPGVIHTLVCDDPNGMKTVFWLNGSLEFYDDDDNLTETFDVFWYIDHYLSYCKEHGLPVNNALFV